MKSASKLLVTLIVMAALTATPTMAFDLGGVLKSFTDRWTNVSAAGEESTGSTIVDLALATPELSTLVQAVLKAWPTLTLEEDAKPPDADEKSEAAE